MKTYSFWGTTRSNEETLINIKKNNKKELLKYCKKNKITIKSSIWRIK